MPRLTRYNARRPCRNCGEPRASGLLDDEMRVTWTRDERLWSWSNERNLYTPEKPPPGVVYTCDERQPGVATGDFAVTCPRCNVARTVTQVRGIYNPKIRCNAKCLEARGFSCECSCGGANHGAGT